MSAATSISTASTTSAVSSVSPAQLGNQYRINIVLPQRSASLDGLRGIAVLLVLGFHTGFPGTRIGWLGVDVFFVLSGFLITTMLTNEFQKRSRINLAHFWGRRFLRLMPVYWLYVGAMTLCLLWFDRSATQNFLGWSPGLYTASLWGYFANYAPMEGIWDRQILCLHLWSLAVEEQFYFVWPLLVALLLRFVPKPGMVAWGILAGIVVTRALVPPITLAHFLHTRGNGIVLGSACALAIYDGSFTNIVKMFENLWLRRAWIAATLGLLAAVTVLRMKEVYSETGVQMWFQPIFCVLFAGITIMLWCQPQSASARFLSFKPLAYIGQISYGIYLYHLVAQYLVWQVLLSGFAPANQYLKYGVRFGAFLLITLAAAILSYHLIERPFLKLKDRLH